MGWIKKQEVASAREMYIVTAVYGLGGNSLDSPGAPVELLKN